MNIGDEFSNENKKTEINFENRKETRNMKNTTALFTIQKLYDICGEAEKGLEHTKINLDASLITKLEEATKFVLYYDSKGNKGIQLALG